VKSEEWWGIVLLRQQIYLHDEEIKLAWRKFISLAS